MLSATFFRKKFFGGNLKLTLVRSHILYFLCLQMASGKRLFTCNVQKLSHFLKKWRFLRKTETGCYVLFFYLNKHDRS